jgi:hypothetical protein
VKKRILILIMVLSLILFFSVNVHSSNKIEGFRMFTWNTPINTVKSVEKEPLLSENIQNINGVKYIILTYSGMFLDIPCKIEYFFHNNKLVAGRYFFPTKDKNAIEKLIIELNKKHGNAILDERDSDYIGIKSNEFTYLKCWADLVNNRIALLTDRGSEEITVSYTGTDNVKIFSQQNTTKESWKIVKSWNGNGIKNTEIFTIKSDEWRIIWTNKGMLLQIYVYPKEESAFSLFDLAANTTEPGSDVSYFHKPGEYYLTISAMGGWSVIVEEK